jgi:prepilin-type N-terminal cleavage/methylation domain-containing protein
VNISHRRSESFSQANQHVVGEVVTMEPPRISARAFTLIELLVVVTIIGILIALLLPAVQAAREAARQATCCNHLKQLALGCMEHENAQGFYPTNGWGVAWTGDADRGFSWNQPGGWIYNVLPYIEQQSLHDLGTGGAWNNASKMALNAQRMAAPLSVLNCPSRRPTILYPYNTSVAHPKSNAAPIPPAVAKNDYAGNGGCKYPCDPTSAPWIMPTPIPGGWGVWGPTSADLVQDPSSGAETAEAKAVFGNAFAITNGIFFAGSTIRPRDVTAGTSRTYLLGEKCCDPDAYFTAGIIGDGGEAYEGENQDIVRWPGMIGWGGNPDPNGTPIVPAPDTPGWVGGATAYFGSAHPNGFFMAYCDGSVHMIHWHNLDPYVWMWMGNRNDTHVISAQNAPK